MEEICASVHPSVRKRRRQARIVSPAATLRAIKARVMLGLRGTGPPARCCDFFTSRRWAATFAVMILAARSGGACDLSSGLFDDGFGFSNFLAISCDGVAGAPYTAFGFYEFLVRPTFPACAVAIVNEALRLRIKFWFPSLFLLRQSTADRIRPMNALRPDEGVTPHQACQELSFEIGVAHTRRLSKTISASVPRPLTNGAQSTRSNHQKHP
jgi:hypothetical protein